MKIKKLWKTREKIKDNIGSKYNNSYDAKYMKIRFYSGDDLSLWQAQDLYDVFMSFNDFTIVAIRRNDYRINFWFITKSEGVDRKRNSSLSEKMWTTKIIKKYRSENMTIKQIHWKKNKEKCLEKGRRY